LSWDVADCPQSVIVEEVRNGVPVRMAILAKALEESANVTNAKKIAVC